MWLLDLSRPLTYLRPDEELELVIAEEIPQPTEQALRPASPVARGAGGLLLPDGILRGKSAQDLDEPRTASESRVTIDSFELGNVLGDGGSCCVVLARKKDTGQLYAIKVVAKTFALDSDVRMKRTLAERRILAKVSHPFVVTLHWAFQSRSQLFLVLEFCPGGELFSKKNITLRWTGF